MRQSKTEGYYGLGVGGDKISTNLSVQSQEAQALTSGANQRRLAQEFSQPNQGDYGIAHKKDMLALVPESRKDRLVSLRGNPDFWEVGDVLAAYRGQHEVGAISDEAERSAVIQAKKERMAAENAAEQAGKAAMKAASDAERSARNANAMAITANRARARELDKYLSGGDQMLNNSVNVTFDEDDLAVGVWE